VNLLKGLYCFREALFALGSGRPDAIDLLGEALLWDEKACQYTPEVLAEFAFLARERCAQAEPVLDIAALVVRCWCEATEDYVLHEGLYTRIIDALQAGQGIPGWNHWIPRFMDLRANSYCFRGLWSDGLQQLRAMQAENGGVFRGSSYGIGVCLDRLGDRAGSLREFQLYISASAKDEFKLPHAYYQLAQHAMLRNDFVEMKAALDAAQESEIRRIPLFDPVESNFPLKDMMISSFQLQTMNRSLRPGSDSESSSDGPSQAVVCQHCGSNPRKLQPCPCREVFYCNKECQKADWKTHKRTCTLRSAPK